MDDVVQHSIVMQVVVVVVIKHDNHDDYNDNRETLFFPGETHIRSTFPGWAQYGRDDRAQMRHQVGQLYVFFNIIITKMRSDFALLPSMKIKNFHRNPELFHGFVLNGPLIVPGFQVVCLKEERCIK